MRLTDLIQNVKSKTSHIVSDDLRAVLSKAKKITLKNVSTVNTGWESIIWALHA